MDQPEKLADQLKSAIEKITFPNHPAELYDPIKYILSLGGKRIRPQLVLMGAEIFGDPCDDTWNAALAIELFHNFTLIHDDIMDDAPLRRGKPTVHEKWNGDIAILSGDAMMIKAYEQLSACTPEKLPAMLGLFNKTAFEVCEGQQMDMNFETTDRVSVDEYLTMISLKTAVLLGASLQLGAISVKADQQNADLLYQFGKFIGIAFQLKDDWLDAYADPSKFGKQVGGDIIAGKKTYLYVKALEIGSQTQQEQLLALMSPENNSISKEEKVRQAKVIFDDLNLSHQLSEEMNGYFRKGMSSLDAIEGTETGKERLKQLAGELMNREV